jgi:hypothetical protein
LDLSLSIDSKLSITAKGHSVFNFWKLDFWSRGKYDFLYTPD